jgi:hypothetical protein
MCSEIAALVGGSAVDRAMLPYVTKFRNESVVRTSFRLAAFGRAWTDVGSRGGSLSQEPP